MASHSSLNRSHILPLKLGTLLLIAVLLITSYLYRQSRAEDLDAANTNGEISGKIVDSSTGRPVRDAEITASGTNYDVLIGNSSGTSNRRGQYTIDKVPCTTGAANSYVIRVEREGCTTAQADVALTFPGYKTRKGDLAIQCNPPPSWWWWLPF